ncbi:sigma-70 family RNA polymerase sigma factor [candidate division WOR-3 bacterium]|nr:sigma-70 family RNA polymerase sigma factor [candidate division WOR-3 bacterium]
MTTGIDLVEELEDDRIIEKVLQGDRECFRVLVERYQKKIYAQIKRKYYIDDDNMDDIMQDTFIKCYKNLHSFKIGKDFYPWLLTIALNITKDFLRKIITSKSRLKETYEDLKHKPEKRDKIYEISELDSIRETISDLSQDYKEVLVLRAEGLSYQEISEKISVPIGTVMSRLNRARKVILEKYSKRDR